MVIDYIRDEIREFLAPSGKTGRGTPRPSVRRESAPVKKPKPASSAPMWQLKGWDRKGDAYTGPFATRFGPRKGRIVFSGPRFISLEIHNPPRELWTSGHPHNICFHKSKKDFYAIHFNDEPKTVDSAIVNTERLFEEAFRMLRFDKRIDGNTEDSGTH